MKTFAVTIRMLVAAAMVWMPMWACCCLSEPADAAVAVAVSSEASHDCCSETDEPALPGEPERSPDCPMGDSTCPSHHDRLVDASCYDDITMVLPVAYELNVQLALMPATTFERPALADMSFLWHTGKTSLNYHGVTLHALNCLMTL